MEEELRSVGRLTWTTTLRFPGKPVSSYPDSIEPMSIAADPKACSLRAVYRHESGLANDAVYLEQISGVDVLSMEDSYNTTFQLHSSVEPLLYSARVDSWNTTDFIFQTKEAAEQFAALPRESVKQCSAVLVTPRAPATDSPSLTETLNFIADSPSDSRSNSGKLTRPNQQIGEGFRSIAG